MAENMMSYPELERYAWTKGIKIEDALEETGVDAATKWRWRNGFKMRHTSARLLREIIDRLALTEELERRKAG